MSQSFFREPSEAEKKDFVSVEEEISDKQQTRKIKEELYKKFSELNRIKILNSKDIKNERLASFDCFWTDYKNGENTGKLEEFNNYLYLKFMKADEAKFMSVKFGHEPDKDELHFTFRCEANIYERVSFCFVKKELPKELISQIDLLPQTSLTKSELDILNIEKEAK